MTRFMTCTAHQCYDDDVMLLGHVAHAAENRSEDRILVGNIEAEAISMA
jgi:hypothetical protein